MNVKRHIEADGRLTIDAEVLRAAGFEPGEAVELEMRHPGLLVLREKDLTDPFERWRGSDTTRPPMSLDEIVAEQREMRGHDDLG